MSDTLWAALVGALVGGGFALLGTIINGRFALLARREQRKSEEQERLAEDRRRVAEFLLTRKYDTLGALYKTYATYVELVAGLYARMSADITLINPAAFHQADEAGTLCAQALTLATAYIDDPVVEGAIATALNTNTQYVNTLRAHYDQYQEFPSQFKPGDIKTDWLVLVKVTARAREHLTRLLNPELLKQFGDSK